MKKSVTLFLTFIFLGMYVLQAQDIYIVNGQVTNENTGAPIPNHAVNIAVNNNSTYYSTVYTDLYGAYSCPIMMLISAVSSIHVMTSDNCVYGIHDTLIVNPPDNTIIANFEICDDPNAQTDCQAEFEFVQGSTNNMEISFFDISTSLGNIDSWSWNFGDGSNSIDQNPVHTYSVAGTYFVCLTIESNNNTCTSTSCLYIQISNLTSDCQANFYYVPDSIDQNTINFYNQSNLINNIISWFWEFGDGTTSTDENPIHTYGVLGTYNVCLTIEALQTEIDTCVSTQCLEIVVEEAQVTYNLGGNTFAGIYQLDHEFAYVYKSEDGIITNIYSQIVDSLGYYLFYPFLAGNYYIKVEPSPNSSFSGEYLPTYYGDAIHWEDAEMINLNQNIFTADIHLIEMALSSSGTGGMNGHIVYETNGMSNVPANDIQIMLANQDGEYVGIKYSNIAGSFEFENLPNGTYTLYAEVMGKSIVPNNFSISDENPVVTDILMVINETNIVFGVEDIQSKYIDKISDIFPNPVNSSLKIGIVLKEPSQVDFNIFNLTGQIMSSKTVDLFQSETIELKTKDLKQGMYFLEIITEDQIKLSKRFIKY